MVYLADVSSRAVLVVSLLSQCVLLVSFSSAASYNPTDFAHSRGRLLRPFLGYFLPGGREGGFFAQMWAGWAYVVQAVLSARHCQTMRRPRGEMLVQTNEWLMRSSDRQMARNDRNEPTAVTDVACSLQTLMYSS